MGKRAVGVLILVVLLGVVAAIGGVAGAAGTSPLVITPAGSRKTTDDVKAQENSDDVKMQETADRAADISAVDRETTEPETESWKTWAKIEIGGETASPEYCDEVVSVEYTDELTLLEGLDKTDHHYACRDGRVYYRRYHEDSFGETALWAQYDPVPNTEKEMVCIDQEGVKTELFKDMGWGDFYLIGERFYMTELVETDSGRERRIYSVDMRGRDRIDYGEGKILAGDEERKCLLLELYGAETTSQNEYCVLDCGSGACTRLGFLPEEHPPEEENGHWDFEGYQDGWIYMSHSRWSREGSRTQETELYAVSVEGEWNKVITLTSDRDYAEYIHQPEMLGDRIFFVFGGYAGSGQYYQGGSIIAVNRDGTDYRSIRGVNSNDRYPSNHYYLQQDEEKILVYSPCAYRIASAQDNGEEEKYMVTVWDIDTKTLRPSDFPAYSIAGNYAYGLHTDEENRVLAMPDRTGRIVRVTGPLEDYIEVLPIDSGGAKSNPQFKELYYKDGYLYFGAEYNEWSHEDSIGWRDGYRRLRTEYYRLKSGEDKAELLYYY